MMRFLKTLIEIPIDAENKVMGKCRENLAFETSYLILRLMLLIECD